MMRLLGINQFDQHVLNMSLISLCNQTSYVGQELAKLHYRSQESSDEATASLWANLYRFTIHIPHPKQTYEDITLEAGLSQGYNVEVQPVQDPNQIPYRIPAGGHFVVVLKQAKLDGDFALAATGIFIRPLAALRLDWIMDIDQGEYQQIVVKHPVIREYPTGWEQKLQLFLQGELQGRDLPDLAQYVDQAYNQDYRSPDWQEVARSTLSSTSL